MGTRKSQYRETDQGIREVGEGDESTIMTTDSKLPGTPNRGLGEIYFS